MCLIIRIYLVDGRLCFSKLFIFKFSARSTEWRRRRRRTRAVTVELYMCAFKRYINMHSALTFVCVECKHTATLSCVFRLHWRTNFFRIQEFFRKSSKRTLALDLPEVKALWVKGGKSLLLDLRPARADPVFKSRLDSRKREETYELKNRAVGANTAAAAAAAVGLSGK